MKEWVDVNLKWMVYGPDYKLSKKYEDDFLSNYKDKRLKQLLKLKFSSKEYEKVSEISYDFRVPYDECNLNKFKELCKDNRVIECFEFQILLSKRKSALIKFLENNENYQKEVKDTTRNFRYSGLCKPGVEIELKKVNGDVVKYIIGDINVFGVMGDPDCWDGAEDGPESDDVVLRYRDLKGEESSTHG